MKAKLAAILLASVALTGCEALTNPTIATLECSTTQTECLNTWFEAKFAEELKFSPLRQTALGMKTDYDKIDDFTVEAAQAQVEWWQKSTAEMEANFDYEELSDEAKLSWDMWQFRKDQAEAAAGYREQEYILTQMNGLHTGLPSFLLTQHKVESESDMTAFIARLGGIGTAMDQLLDRAKTNAAAGTRPPRFAYDAVIEESGKLISGAPFDDGGEPSALWKASEGHLTKLVEEGTITEDRADDLREEARAALTTQMAPAYKRVIDWFTEDRANTSEQAQGVSTLDNGTDFYNY
ncbi:MAG: DUF885 family protein, partial [Pseudomonadota bacterium]